jgi:hypothetical protein
MHLKLIPVVHFSPGRFGACVVKSLPYCSFHSIADPAQLMVISVHFSIFLQEALKTKNDWTAWLDSADRKNRAACCSKPPTMVNYAGNSFRMACSNLARFHAGLRKAAPAPGLRLP